MKTLKILLACVLTCLSLYSAHAQEVYYTPYENYDWRNGDYAVAGKINGLQYIYRSNNNGYYLDAYDDNMQKVATVVLDFFSGKVYDTRFIITDNRMIVFYQSVESGKITQYAALLDDKGILQKRPIVIDASKQPFFGSARNYFKTIVSDDKKKIMVYETTIKGAAINIDATWLDNQLTVLSKCHTSYTLDNDAEVGEGLLHNDGTFYLPAYTPTGGRNYADQLMLLVLPQAERKFTAKELPLSLKYAAGTYMKLDVNNDKIYIAGFYADKKNSLYEGVLYSYYNIKTGSYEPLKLMPFGDNVQEEAKKKKAYSDFMVRNLIVKNDGGFVLIAEDYFVSTRNSYSPGMGYYSFYYPTMGASVREYNYRDIMVMSYDGEGNRQWRSFIRKDQYSQEDGGMFSSFAMVNTGGALGFLFNDFNSSRSRVQLASVEGDGKILMQALTTNQGNDDADWMPRQAKQVSAREIIIPCLRKRQICFAKVVF